MKKKFVQAQSHFVTSLLIAVLVTFVIIYFIPGNGTGWFSYLVGLSFALSATIITQSFWGQILDYRSRNLPAPKDEWVSVLVFYLSGFGIAFGFYLLRLVIKNLAWGFVVGTMSGVVITSLIIFMSVGGLPWVEKHKSSVT